MSHWQTRIKLFNHFLSHYVSAQTIYDIHSPFVYAFAKEVLEDNRMFYPFKIIESLRQGLLQNHKVIQIKDYGAGSKANKQTSRPISNIVKYSAISPATGRQLFRLVNWHKPKTILELGTSTGISTMYLSAGALNAKVITLEGCPETAKVAQQNFRRLGLQQVSLINDPFETGLQKAINWLPQLDFAFIDGNHQAGATIDYYQKLQRILHEESVVVVADIYWSEEMQRAWKNLCQDPTVTLAIDLFHFGVLYRHSIFQEKQTIPLVPSKWKPWHLGIFTPRVPKG